MKKGAKGIDISRYQNFNVEIMKKIKEAGIEFVIIRSSYGTWKDIRFEQHYAAAIAAGLKVGAYHYYNYADPSLSANETATFLAAVAGKVFGLGLYIDFENRGDYAKGRHLGMLTPEQVTDRAIAAITSIKEAGFSAGIYCDTDWAKHKMNMKRLPANTIFWIADWKGKLDFDPCDIRQYSSTEGIPGIGSGIDMNELQRDMCEELVMSGHIQNLGWQDGEQIIGTVGQSLRLEAVKIDLQGVEYRAHVQDIGWLDWVASGQIAGTTGESRRMEAIQIIGPVMYRAHVQDIGWMDWVNSGETAGTTGQSKRLEAIEIKML